MDKTESSGQSLDLQQAKPATRENRKMLEFPAELRERLEARAQRAGDGFGFHVMKILKEYLDAADAQPVAPPTLSPEPVRRRVSCEELAKAFHVHPNDVRRWRHDPSFPRPVGKRHVALLYDQEEAFRWMQEVRGLHPKDAHDGEVSP